MADVEDGNISWNGRYGVNVDGGILEITPFIGVSGNMLQVNEMLISHTDICE